MTKDNQRFATHEQKIFALAVGAGLPGLLATGVLLYLGDYRSVTTWAILAVVSAAWLGISYRLVARVRFPLRTLAAILAGFREGDYSARVVGEQASDALGEVIHEVNSLGDLLRQRRLDALEATALLKTVMGEIDVAIFAFDQDEKLQLVNRAGERLLGRPSEQLRGRSAQQLGMDECLKGETTRTLSRSFAGGMGRWGVRRSIFREKGHPHQLVVITDLSRALREEERLAWKRIVRVIGHEINNSLAPIQSITGSLHKILDRDPRPADWEEDLSGGLSVIESRAESLGRFMNAYARLAKLPAPEKITVNVHEWISRNASMETRVNVSVTPGPSLTVEADPDQLDQLLINLIRNATDAALSMHPTEKAGETQQRSTAEYPEVHITWQLTQHDCVVQVRDNGPGIESTDNLFVPFFSTKPGGSGIGLALCRQIVEAHDGSLTLENVPHGQGCIACLTLPGKTGQQG